MPDRPYYLLKVGERMINLAMVQSIDIIDDQVRVKFDADHYETFSEDDGRELRKALDTLLDQA